MKYFYSFYISCKCGIKTFLKWSISKYFQDTHWWDPNFLSIKLSFVNKQHPIHGAFQESKPYHPTKCLIGGSTGT